MLLEYEIYNWKQRIAEEASGEHLTGEDREELLRLRKEVKKLCIEKEILKKASAYFAKEMKWNSKQSTVGVKLFSGGSVFSVTRQYWQLLSLAALASQVF